MSAIPKMSEPEVDARVQALTERLTPIAARLNYLAGFLQLMLDVGEPEDRNAFYAASRMLGCTPAFARKIVGAVGRHGSAEAWLAWRAQAPALPVFKVPELAPGLVGIVYFASPASSPNVVKIGISANIGRRMRDLEAETGEEHRIRRWFVGTTVDEAVAQFTMAGRRINGKWYATGEPEQIPGFLPMGLAGMRDLLGADLLKRRAA